jgi:hypothetical protein
MDRTTLLIAAGAMAFAGAAVAQEQFAVLVPAVLDPSAPIGDAVKRECGVESKVGTEVFSRVAERYPAEQVANAAQAGDRLVLKVTLLSVVGHGGGGWSGTKAIAIRADVLRDSKVIATRTMNRQSGGGVFGGVTGTCAIMDRIAVALGRDVAAWLPGALMVLKYEKPASDQPAAPREAEAPKQ